MDHENDIKSCHVALYDITEKEKQNKSCDQNNNNDRNDECAQQSQVEKCQLKPCFVQLKKLKNDADISLISSKSIEQELVKKFNLKPCVVLLTDCHASDANFSTESIDRELALNEVETDQDESMEWISISSSQTTVTDATSQADDNRLTRVANDDSPIRVKVGKQFNLKPCMVLLTNCHVIAKKQRSEGQELVEKFNLKPCVVLLTDYRAPDANFPTAPNVGEIALNENEDQNESMQSISSSHKTVNDAASQFVIRLTRVANDDFSICDTHFSVDKFMSTANVEHHFLTRFHPDQYVGLTENFSRHLYASGITGK